MGCSSLDKEYNSHNEILEFCINTYIDSKRNILSPSTIRRYKLFIKNIPKKLLNTTINNINTIKLQTVINDYAKSHSPKSTKDLYGFIKSVLNVYTDKKFKIILPPLIKKQTYIPTKEVVLKILNEAKNTQYEIPILLASYGMRIGEILALTLDKVKDGEIIIDKTQTIDKYNCKIITPPPKAIESTRTIKIPTYITDLIKQKREIYKSSANAINRFLYKVEKQLNIPRFSIHKLRHFFASELHYRSIPSKYIQAIGGWATDNVIKTIYIHTNQDIKTINIFD